MSVSYTNDAVTPRELRQAYLVHVSDEQGPLFYVRVEPTAEIWLRPGASAEDVAVIARQTPRLYCCP